MRSNRLQRYVKKMTRANKICFFLLFSEKIFFIAKKFAYIKLFLYFCTRKPNMLIAMYLFIVILLLIFGVLLMTAELFLLPGFGAAGIAGVLSLVGSVVVAYLYISPLAGHIALCLSLVLSVVAAIVFFRSRAIEKMGLDTEIDGKVEMPKAGKHMEEMKGV